MTRLAVMQPYLFPYIGYFHLMHAVDRFVVLDDVGYIKGGWINRNVILVDGTPTRFTLPVHNVSQNRLILEHERADDERWCSRWLRTLERSYGKAPCFVPTFDLVISVLADPERRLSPWITMTLQRICTHLSLPVTIIPTSSIYANAEIRGQERMIDICWREHATQYVNAGGGTSLYSPSRFDAASINLRFVRSRFTPYSQAATSFVPGLSILDVLMHNHPEEIRERLFTYDLT